MWMGRRMAGAAQLAREESAEAEVGMTTIGGGQAAVVTRGEDRALPVYGPGGVVWSPRVGDAVLVIKGGCGREERCIAGTLMQWKGDELEPGEVGLYNGDASVILRNSGTVEIRGTVDIQGDLSVNGVPYMPCMC